MPYIQTSKDHHKFLSKFIHTSTMINQTSMTFQLILFQDCFILAYESISFPRLEKKYPRLLIRLHQHVYQDMAEIPIIRQNTKAIRFAPNTVIDSHDGEGLDFSGQRSRFYYNSMDLTGVEPSCPSQGKGNGEEEIVQLDYIHVTFTIRSTARMITNPTAPPDNQIEPHS